MCEVCRSVVLLLNLCQADGEDGRNDAPLNDDCQMASAGMMTIRSSGGF
jgi:hypothetical protein